MNKEDKDALAELVRYDKWINDTKARCKDLLKEGVKVDPSDAKKIRLLSMIWLDLPEIKTL